MKETWQTLRTLLGNYRRTLQLVWDASPRYAFLATLFATLSAVTGPAQIWVSKVIIDRIISTIQNHLPNTIIDWTTLVIATEIIQC